MASPHEALEALRVTDPAKYRRIVEQQKRFAFVPHSPGQRAVLDSQARFIVVRAGRRYGKTKVAARKLIRHALRTPGTVDWWVGNVYKNTRRGYREVLRQLPPQFLKKPAPPATANDLILELKNGSRIEFYSGTNPDAMAGEGVGFVVVDEAALQQEVVWTQTIRPTLMDHGGGALLISTPRGRNWFWQLYRRGEDPEYGEYEAFHFTTADNPLIAASEIEEARQALPDVVFRQEIMAEFIAGAASIFVVPEANVLEGPTGFQPGEQIIVGVDLAKHHDFTVIDAVRMSDRKPVYHDRFNSIRWGEQKERIIDVVEHLESLGASQVTVAIDATGVGDVVFDDLEEYGLDVVPVKFSMQWKNQAVKLLAAALEQGEAYVLLDQVKEFEDYEYRITPGGNFVYSAPEGGHDDEVSAKLLQHWAVVHETLTEQSVRTIDMGGVVPPEVAEAEREKPALVKASQKVEPRSASDMLNDPTVWNR
jgi:hypothetical protein